MVQKLYCNSKAVGLFPWEDTEITLCKLLKLNCFHKISSYVLGYLSDSQEIYMLLVFLSVGGLCILLEEIEKVSNGLAGWTELHTRDSVITAAAKIW